MASSERPVTSTDRLGPWACDSMLIRLPETAPGVTPARIGRLQTTGHAIAPGDLANPPPSLLLGQLLLPFIARPPARATTSRVRQSVSRSRSGGSPSVRQVQRQPFVRLAAAAPEGFRRRGRGPAAGLGRPRRRQRRAAPGPRRLRRPRHRRRPPRRPQHTPRGDGRRLPRPPRLQPPGPAARGGAAAQLVDRLGAVPAGNRKGNAARFGGEDPAANPGV
jgi:hypothetical protein